MAYAGYDQFEKKQIEMINNKIESDMHKIKSRTMLAALLHGVLAIWTFYAWASTDDRKSATYDLYRAAVVGNIQSPNGKAENGSFVDVVRMQLNKTCPNSQLTLLSMEAKMERPNRNIEDTFTSTWIATKSTVLGLVQINGYGLLFGIFVISFISQIKVLYELKRKNDIFFERPCAARWFEYALTSPLMVIIVGMCLLLRDINTIVLLSVAQGALVQFGYAMECAFTMSEIEDTYGCQSDVDMISFKALVPNAKTEGRSFPRISQQLWYWSFTPAMVLHLAIWTILVGNWIEFNSKPCWIDTTGGESAQAPAWLVAILFGQLALFSSFILVALGQANDLCMLPWQKSAECIYAPSKSPAIKALTVKRSFTKAFGRYALLSAVAKVFLGATYLLYVSNFPFYTGS